MSRNVKKAVKNESWNKRCDEINGHIGGTRTKKAWKAIKTKN